jgi:hypothetical protein
MEPNPTAYIRLDSRAVSAKYHCTATEPMHPKAVIAVKLGKNRH